MNPNADFDRIAQSWLQDGPTEMPDRSLQVALDEVHLTSQQRFGAARRTLPMNVFASRLAIAAVIGLLVVAAGGIYLGNSGSGGVGGQAPQVASPSQSPSPTAFPSPSPSPTASPLELPRDEGTLQAGTYIAGDPFLVPLTFVVPAGSVGRLGGPYRAYVAAGPAQPDLVGFSVFDQVFADPCHYDQGLVQPGPTVDDLVAALTAMPSISATAPIDVTVDGYQGKQMTITAPDNFNGCTLSPDGFALWQLPAGATWTMRFAESDRVSIIDVDGQRLVINVAEVGPYMYTEEHAKALAIWDSIKIEPTAPAASPQASP